MAGSLEAEVEHVVDSLKRLRLEEHDVNSLINEMISISNKTNNPIETFKGITRLLLRTIRLGQHL